MGRLMLRSDLKGLLTVFLCIPATIAQLLVPTIVDTFYLPLGRVPAFRSNITSAAADVAMQLGETLTPEVVTSTKKALAQRGVEFPTVTRVAVTPFFRVSLFASTIPLPSSAEEAVGWLENPPLAVTKAIFSPYTADARLQFFYGGDYQAGYIDPALVNTAGGNIALPRAATGRRRRHLLRDAAQSIDTQSDFMKLLVRCITDVQHVVAGKSIAGSRTGGIRHTLASGHTNVTSLIQGLAAAWEAHHQGAINATLAGWGDLLSLVLRQQLLGFFDLVPNVRFGESWGVTQIPTYDTTFFFRVGFDVIAGVSKALYLGSNGTTLPRPRPVPGHRRRRLLSTAPAPAPAPSASPPGISISETDVTISLLAGQILPPILRRNVLALLQAISADSQAMAASLQPIIAQLQSGQSITRIVDIVFAPSLSAVPGQLSFIIPDTLQKWAGLLNDPTLGLLLQSLAGFSVGVSFSVTVFSSLALPPLAISTPPAHNQTRRSLHSDAPPIRQGPEAVFSAALALLGEHSGISARLQQLFLVIGFIESKAISVQFETGLQRRTEAREQSSVARPFRGAGVIVDAAIVKSAFTFATWTVSVASSAIVGFSPTLPKAAGGPGAVVTRALVPGQASG